MIVAFRLGHRVPRDERMTTHIALVTRALGGDGMYYSGMRDEGMERSVMNVVKRWGGSFFVQYVEKPKKFLKELKAKGFVLVHLTMYGIPLDSVRIDPNQNMVIIVGGEKVPSWVYRLSDFNVSVTNQPHSEVAALALCLDRIWRGQELTLEFQKARFSGGIEIIPSERGKIIRKKP
jgi:tRNA (cytidine56-2'-O)-methyltransferase